MNKLKELINKLCPNGVKFEELKEICMVSIGEFVHKNKQREDAKYPVFNGGISNTGFYDEYNNEGNKILISARGANAGFINKIESRYWAGNSCYSIDIKDKGSINWLYVYYYLKNNEKSLLGQQQTGSIPAISKKQIESFKIPVPPLEVQCKIVHILDDFTLLSAELSAELKARQMQYEYYRNRLIKETNKVECKNLTLEDILKIKNGKDYKHLKKGKYPVYGTGGVMTYVDDFVYNKPSVLIPRKGSLDKIYYVEEPFWNVDTIFYTEINENEVIPKYVYYYLQNEHLEKLNIAGGIPSLTQATLNKVKITIPSKDIQKSVVEVLDNFDKICNSLMDGLPAEIEARQKQYEYYRNKLLTFKELKVNE